ncbi:hypothetical protein E4U32_004953 [Claviceps aff. humidiphila group G2b]|nr:hypothetical protein E4U32_004952 [Claviceps aff. humidiphila group G2b]KAG6057759.1 hypothetical protein E4U32_004953 [Claviceps aff. humidiphila group G2b]
MPPRKSSDAAPLPARTRLVDKAPSASASVDGLPGSSESSGTGGSKEGREKEREREYVTIEDLALPKSIITRLAKGVLPPNAQIQATAALAMSKSATVFINYLAAHANERTINANKKTILPADVFQALDDIQFSFFKEPLEAEFAKYHQIRSDKRTDYRRRTKSSKLDPDPNTNTNNPDGDTSTTNPPTPSDRDAAGPRSKKARMESQHEGDVEADLTEDERDAGQDDEEDHDVEEEQPEEQDEEGEEEVEDELEEEEEEEVDDTGAPVDEMQDVVEEGALVMEERDEALGGDESD